MNSNRDQQPPPAAEPMRQMGAPTQYEKTLRAPTSGASWNVEAEHLDRGDGPRSWFVVRHGDQVWYCAGRGELVAFLEDHGVTAGDIAVPEAGLPSGEDGCE
jgi:hypothetical protein